MSADEQRLCARLLSGSNFTEVVSARGELNLSLWRLETDKQISALNAQLSSLIRALCEELSTLPAMILLATPLGGLKGEQLGSEMGSALSKLTGELTAWFSLVEPDEILVDLEVLELFEVDAEGRSPTLRDRLHVQGEQLYEPWEGATLQVAPLRLSLTTESSTSRPLQAHKYPSRQIGRTVERAHVEAKLRRLGARHMMTRRALEICGGAGMGKTTFLESILPLISEKKLTLLRTLCVDFVSADIEAPLAILTRALLDRCRAHSGESHSPIERDRELLAWCIDQGFISQDASLFSILELLRIPLLSEEQSALSLVQEEDLWRLRAEIVSDWLCGLSRLEPLCLIVEDTHWIDPELCVMIERLLGALDKSTHLCLIYTTRPERDLSDLISSLEGARERIELKPLS